MGAGEDEGNRLLDTYSTRRLVLFATFLRKATEVQEAVRSGCGRGSSRPRLRRGVRICAEVCRPQRCGA